MTTEKLVGVTEPEKERKGDQTEELWEQTPGQRWCEGQGEAGEWDIPQGREGHHESGQMAGVTGQGTALSTPLVAQVYLLNKERGDR